MQSLFVEICMFCSNIFVNLKKFKNNNKKNALVNVINDRKHVPAATHIYPYVCLISFNLIRQIIQQSEYSLTKQITP